MATTGLHEAASALVTGLRAESGFGDPASTTGVPVFFGPAPTGLAVPQFVVVGDDGDGNMGDEDVEWHTLGPTPDRRCTGTVNVLCCSWGGTDALTAAESKASEAMALVAAVEKVAHSLEALPSSVSIEAHYAGGSARFEASEASMACVVQARVTFTVILTSWS